MNDIHLWPANRVISGSKIWAVVLSVHKVSQTMATCGIIYGWKLRPPKDSSPN